MEQNMNNISHDLLYYIITGFGLSIIDIQNLCSVNQRFRKICKDKNVWKQVFLKKINPTNDQSLNDMWDSLECKGFVKILAFAFEKELMESDDVLIFFNDRENLGFKCFRVYQGFTFKSIFVANVILMQKNKDEKYDVMRVDEQEKRLIKTSSSFPERFLEIINRYNLTFTGRFPGGSPSFTLLELPKLFCELFNNGYKFSKKKEELLPPTLTKACITCGITKNLLQCSGSCSQIYCSEDCQAKNHRNCKWKS